MAFRSRFHVGAVREPPLREILANRPDVRVQRESIMARNQSKSATTQSTAQQLASLVKSCRDIMRKDKGLNGDLDRLPMLTWIMFLKFLAI